MARDRPEEFELEREGLNACGRCLLCCFCEFTASPDCNSIVQCLETWTQCQFVVNDEESTEGLPSLDKPGWYSQGNWAHLHELLKTMTGNSEPQGVYFGDSMHSDVFPASCYGHWETVLILEELEGKGAQTSDAKSKDADAEPLEKKGKYDSMNMKTPSAPSEQWGSYFLDVCKGLKEEEEEGSLKYTWCCHSINTYSTIAIPSIEAIAALPLDYKFPRFLPNKPRTTGYYPRPPESLLKMSENSPRE